MEGKIGCLKPGAFADLLSAFAQDVTKQRYADVSEVLDYCRRSANPVGRLVLRIAGYEDARLDRASDAELPVEREVDDRVGFFGEDLLRELLSGPWQRKHVSDMMGRISRLKRTVSAP